MNNIMKKTVAVYQQYGAREVVNRAGRKIIKKLIKNLNHPLQNDPEFKFVDVFFINGCGSSVPHPSRYRITHQREQLEAYNISTDEVFYTDLQIEQVKNAHVFIFFRCPYTDVIGEFIELAKSLNKTVLFDIDDLVIDTKYTDEIEYIKSMNGADREIYDDGVNRMGHTLKLCDGAITTTERLAEELSHYVPEVFINRNTASERMYELSEIAKNKVIRMDDEIRIGYFSGSITHNDDFALVLPALIRIMSDNKRVRLYIVGELDIPEILEPYKKQIVVTPFLDWQKLPELIASCDINLAPLEQTIFNEAKSENKWVEASLVQVVTVASDVGAFRRMIQHGETGFLCKTPDDWYETLKLLVLDGGLRKKIAAQAYEFVIRNCITLYSGQGIAEYINSKRHLSLGLCLPSTGISGGNMVALKHALYMKQNGYDVTIIAINPPLKWMGIEKEQFPVIWEEKSNIRAHFDKVIATMWSTTGLIENYPKISDRYYLVQNFEVDFYKPGSILRINANRTYNLNHNIQYVTISKWCQTWLKEKYGKESKYAPNGINTEKFKYCDRDFSGKIRVLIEGDCRYDFKRIDESFRITNTLDRNRFEIWFMSYNETTKDWYKYDRFLCRVPYDEVPDVYYQCHILLKSSVLESFSYPPLEMMATGGLVVVVPNDGNSEYLRDEENCLLYESGNSNDAIEKIYRLIEDETLRYKLSKNGIETAMKYDWEKIKNKIMDMYL